MPRSGGAPLEPLPRLFGCVVNPVPVELKLACRLFAATDPFGREPVPLIKIDMQMGAEVFMTSLILSLGPGLKI